MKCVVKLKCEKKNFFEKELSIMLEPFVLYSTKIKTYLGHLSNGSVTEIRDGTKAEKNKSIMAFPYKKEVKRAAEASHAQFSIFN